MNESGPDTWWRPWTDKFERPVRIVGLSILGLVTPPLTVFLAIWLLLLMLGFHRNDVVGVYRNFLGFRAEVLLESADLARERTASPELFGAATRDYELLGFHVEDELSLGRAGYRAWLRLFASEDARTWSFVRQSVYPTTVPTERALLSRCSSGEWVQTSDEPTDDIQGDIPPFVRSLYLGPVSTAVLVDAHRGVVRELCGEASAQDRLTVADLHAFFLRDRTWWFDHCAHDVFAMVRACTQGDEPRVPKATEMP